MPATFVPKSVWPRRHALKWLSLFATAPWSVHVQASSLASLSGTDAQAGLRAALERGASLAINQLGRTDGFLMNPQVRIPLPEFLESNQDVLRAMGQGRRLDELSIAMNRAAEAAVPMGRDILFNAVRQLTVSDAKAILTGGDTAVTDFFAERTRVPLTIRFMPLIKRTTQQVSLAQKYNDLAGRASRLGLFRSPDANLEQFVTNRTLDGLFWAISEEERKIRRDPVATGSQILQRVFGALR